MAEITDSKTRQQDQQAYQEYKDRLQQQIRDKEVLKALEELKHERSTGQVPQQVAGPAPTVEPKAEDPSTYDDPTETRMRNVQRKVAPYQTWGSMAGVPLIAKDSFAPMFSGTRFAEGAREYSFNRRVSRLQSSARTDEREAMMLAARLDPAEHQNTPTHELERLAKDSYFSRRFAPLNEDEAVRFANMGLNKSASTSGDLRSEQYKFLGLRRPEDGPGITDSMKYDAAKALQHAKIKTHAALGVDAPNITPLQRPSAPTAYSPEQLSQMVNEKAVSDFMDRQSGVRATAGKILYGSSSERHGALKNMPIDLSGDTTAGRMLGHLGSTANIGFSALPAASVGLGGAANFQKLANLRRDRHMTGAAGKWAEGATTTAQLTRSALFAPAASLMAIRGMTGTDGMLGGLATGAYRGAKDASFGVTSTLGSGVLKGASGLTNLIPGVDGVNLGASLAGAAKGVGFGASMASLAPALAGGLALALPGIIGSVATAKADKKRRILRGFKQPTDKLVKQFSRSRGVDSVIRNLFSAREITSDRMLELQLLMYIEQNTSSIPRMVSDIGLMSDRQEKDTGETLNQIDLQQQQADERAPGFFKRMGQRIGYGADRTMIGAQELAHTLNIPGQVFDLLINRKTPWARKEEFRQAKEDSFFSFKQPEHSRKVAQALGTSPSHVQLLGTPGSRLIRATGAESAEAQQLAVQVGIYDLLRYEFGMKSRQHLKSRGMSLEQESPFEEVTGFKKFLQMIPGVSSVVSAVEGGKKLVQGISGLKDKAIDLKDKAKEIIPNLTFGRVQRERLASGEQIKEKLGLTKTFDQKIETFQLRLPDLWAQLIHLNELTVNALNNIFNVGNKLLSTTGQQVEFQEADSEQKILDFNTGKYLTAKEYNKLIVDRRKDYAEETKEGKAGFMTRVARKLFGRGEDEVKEARIKHLGEQYQSEELSMARKTSLSSQMANVDAYQQADGYGQRVVGGEFTVGGDSCIPICPKSAGAIRSEVPPLREVQDKPDQPKAKVLQFPGTATRTVEMETDEIEEREETKKRDETRKDTRVSFKKIIKKLDKLVGNTKSFGGKVIESGRGFFGRLGGMIMGAIGPLIAMATPLIAAIGGLVAPLTTVAAGIAALTGISMFRRRKEGIGTKEGAVDTMQDLGMVRNAGKIAAEKAGSIGRSIYNTGHGAYRGASTIGQMAKEGATTRGGMLGKYADKIGSVASKGAAFAGETTQRMGRAIAQAPGKIGAFAGRTMDALRGGGTLAKGAGLIGSGISKVAGIAGKYSPHMMIADSALRFGGDLRDGSRFEKRSDVFQKEMAESGMFGKAWAITKKVINPYEGGALAGTAINKGINKAMEAMTGEKGATLGGKIYDWLHPGEAKRAREADAKIKAFQESRRLKEEHKALRLVNDPADVVKANEINKQREQQKLGIEPLKTKTEEQTGVIRSGFDRLVASSEGLLSFFKSKSPGPDPSPAEKTDKVGGGLDNVLNFINSNTYQAPNQRHEASPDRLNIQQIKDNVIQLRESDELPTVKEVHRQEAKVEVPQHSSVPMPMSTGTDPSKIQSTQDRPINPQLTGFVDNLFTNTITSLQQGIKTFAQGQTPFQIIR